MIHVIIDITTSVTCMCTFFIIRAVNIVVPDLSPFFHAVNYICYLYASQIFTLDKFFVSSCLTYYFSTTFFFSDSCLSSDCRGFRFWCLPTVRHTVPGIFLFPFQNFHCSLLQTKLLVLVLRANTPLVSIIWQLTFSHWSVDRYRYP